MDDIIGLRTHFLSYIFYLTISGNLPAFGVGRACGVPLRNALGVQRGGVVLC